MRKLSTDDDASKLAMLLSSRKDRPRETVKKYINLINKQRTHNISRIGGDGRSVETCGTAALFARSDNYSAIKVYEKIGYKISSEKFWIDAGTRIKTGARVNDNFKNQQLNVCDRGEK